MKTKQPRVTHQQIADQLGVSRVSVTQALHQTRRSTLSPQLQRRILEAARDLNYQPRNVATRTIGIVGTMESWGQAGDSRLLQKMDQALREADYRLLIANVQNGELEPLRRLLTPKTVDGVLFTRWFDGQIQNILPAEIPWVVTSDEDGIGDEVDVVTVATRDTAALLARHLIERGHQRIGLVTGTGDTHYHGHLKHGVKRAMYEADVPIEKLEIVDVKHDREMKAPLLALMKTKQAPTAIIAASSEKAITVMNLLCTKGIKVPRDVSVVSMADSYLLDPWTPAVTATTIGDTSAAAAVHHLLGKIRDPLRPARRVLLPGEIIARESVAPPRKSGD